jgi:magnesium-protoporphyrin IX monomethyl ester (oxidative) cyclase
MAAVMSASLVAPRVAKLGARAGKTASLKATPVRVARAARASTVAGAAVDNETGLKMARDGIKEAANENLLTPRFYTTDFDEMEQLFSTEINPNLDESELVAILQEFQEDFNQKHFVRNDSFKTAADGITGESRRIFIEFLERSCTAEFSGFLLYKELGRRLKKTAPVCAEIFTLMSRDEARHAGFLNKAMSDFNLALDLGFLTKNRQYTFFKPKFIFYATYLSEKIGYWRYISIYRHLQANPDDQLYPIFQYFENWCQDENRHGDFFTAVLKARPEFINDFEAKLWSRFFCLSVYVTMYLNDHSRAEFYESIGLDTTKFNMHVIHQTNKTTAQIFPQVIDTYNPKFKEHLDKLVVINTALAKAESPLEKAPLVAGFASNLLAIALMKPIDSGSIDFVEDVSDPAFMY